MNKAYSFTRHFFIAILLVFIAQVSWASIFTSINPGNWDDPNTWDCACIPPNPLPSGDQVTVSHLITISTGASKTISTDATLNIESTLTNEGIVNVEPNGNFRIVAGGTFTNTGTLNHSGNMSLENNPASLPGGTFNWITGIIDVTFGVSLSINSSFTIPAGCSINLTGGSLVNNSTINVNGSMGLIFGGTVDNTNGTLNINSGGLLAHVFGNYGPITQGTFNWNSGGTILTSGNANYTISSHMTIEPGRIFWVDAGSSMTNTSTITNNGTLKGSGTFNQNGTFNNNNSIAPGSSPGTFTVSGSIDLGTGTYDCEINGTTAGSTYDVIDVSSTATITNASLVVDWGSFTPGSGDTYTVLTAGSVVGEFASVTIPSKGGIDFEVAYDGTTVVVQPEGFSLPVELTSFTATPNAGDVLLKWQTDSEKDNAGFEIERSSDSRNWQTLSFVEGHGTTLTSQHYKFIDRQPAPGINYYRLQQVDFDGKIEYSHIVSVEIASGDHTASVKLFPNPVSSDKLTVSTNFDFSGDHTIRIIDLQGKLIIEKAYHLETGQSLELDIADLSAGIYFIEIKTGSELWQEQFIVK